MGECRRPWPVANGSGRAIWPLTLPSDVCASHKYGFGSGTQSKITDAEILEIVRSMTSGGQGYKRGHLIATLCDRGLARSSAKERVARMNSCGLLCVGLIAAPEGQPLWNSKHAAVWLPGAEPAAAGAVDPEAIVEQRARGRPAYTPDIFVPILRERFPSGAQHGYRAEFIRAMREVRPTLSESVAARIINELVDDGTILLNGAMMWAPTPAQAPVATPTIEVE